MKSEYVTFSIVGGARSFSDINKHMVFIRSVANNCNTTAEFDGHFLSNPCENHKMMRPHWDFVCLHFLANISSKAPRATNLLLSDRPGKQANCAYCVGFFIKSRDGVAGRMFLI